MKRALLFHGTPTKDEYFSDKIPVLSNCHWFPWLQKQLMKLGWETHAPEVFESYEPTYEKWLKELERYDVDDETVLVGHSCGGGFLLRWMHENPDQVIKKVVLVAPWIDPYSDKSGDMFDVDFIIQNQDKVVVYQSDDDMEDVIESCRLIRDFMPDAKYVDFKGYGHFCYEFNMETLDFPELLEEILV